MKDGDNNQDVTDMIESAIDFYQQNKDIVESFMPESNSVQIDEKSPLKEAIIQDDEVIIAVETHDEGFSDVLIDETEQGVAVGINGEKIMAKVPEDVSIEDAQANLNNGVLEVKIPRTGGDE